MKLKSVLFVALLICLAPVAWGQGTDACPGTVIAGPLPYADNSNNCAASNDVMDYASASCNALPNAYPGNDLVYQVTVGAGNNVTATLTPGAGVDLGIFIVSNCADGTSCISFQDLVGGGGEAMITGQAPGTYYIYIDSYYAGGSAPACGDYTLDVTGTLPVELLDFNIH